MRYAPSIPLALAIVRVFALMPVMARASERASLSTLETVIIYGGAAWVALTAGAWLFRKPASLFGIQLQAAGDAILAVALAISGPIMPPLCILALALCNWVAYGGLPVTALPILAPAACWALLGFIVRTVRGGGMFNLTALDGVFALLATVCTIWAVARFARMQADLRRLADRYDLSELMSMHSPFAFQLGEWLSQVSELIGNPRRTCAILVANAEGAPQIHASRPAHVSDDIDTAELLRIARGLPPRFAPLASAAGNGRDGAGTERTVRQFVRRLAPECTIEHIVVRTVAVGRIHGLVLVAPDLPIDDATRVLLARIDEAIDTLFDKLCDTFEMRRRFIAEAREISRRDLHDGVLQTLAALRMRLSTIAQAASDNADLASDLRRTSEIVSLEQARLRALLESGLDQDQPVNLIDSLKICLRTISLQWNIEASMATEEMAIATDREAAANIEHLVREIVANASRHSASRKVSLGLALRDSSLLLTLRDHTARTGAKSPVSNPLDSKSLQQRLALVNGEAYWETVRKGTLLAITIPRMEDMRVE